MKNWITPLTEVVDKIHNETEFGEYDAMFVIAHQGGNQKRERQAQYHLLH